jgi:hypothetical protein
MDLTTESAQPTAEQMQVYMTQWMDWMDQLVETDQLSEGGNHFSKAGKVLRPNGVISDQPYTVNNESVAGYIIVFAEDLNAAARIGLTCPILKGEGTSVEVRELGNPR